MSNVTVTRIDGFNFDNIKTVVVYFEVNGHKTSLKLEADFNKLTEKFVKDVIEHALDESYGSEDSIMHPLHPISITFSPSVQVILPSA